jgi:RNA polymerase sigma factor (sigma-70 family)
MTGAESDTSGTVYIVDDNRNICESLCDLLESAGIAARHFSSAEEFLAAWQPCMEGCLLLDVRLPGMSGMELQEKLLKENLRVPIIIMTAHGDIPMVRKALKSGAVEFLVKPFQDHELLNAIEQIFDQSRKQRETDDKFKSVSDRIQTLTPREREVLELVAAGYTNKEIAEKLYLSIVTIKMHRGQMMRKMQAETVADLVRMADLAKSPGFSSAT